MDRVVITRSKDDNLLIDREVHVKDSGNSHQRKLWRALFEKGVQRPYRREDRIIVRDDSILPDIPFPGQATVELLPLRSPDIDEQYHLNEATAMAACSEARRIAQDIDMHNAMSRVELGPAVKVELIEVCRECGGRANEPLEITDDLGNHPDPQFYICHNAFHSDWNGLKD